MGSRYLTDLADVVRSTGLVVQEEPGWQTRARSSGGYNSGLPNHVMVHHTASGASSDGQPDVNYMCYGSENRPVANLYLSRSGKVWIMAAGATNTNGSGSDPCGATANDSMNSAAIGIEAGNNGTGEPWPQAQQDAYTKLCKKLCDHYGIPVARVHSHAEWAPGRKIDPAGPSQWASSGTWNEDAFRTSVAAAGGGSTPAPERKVKMYVLLQDEGGGMYASDSIACRWIQDGEALAWYQSMLTVFGFNTKPTMVKRAAVVKGTYGVMTGPLPDGGFAEGGFVWNHNVQAPNWPLGPAANYLCDGRVSANNAEQYSKQAAENTMPTGQKVAEPKPPKKV